MIRMVKRNKRFKRFITFKQFKRVKGKIKLALFGWVFVAAFVDTVRFPQLQI